jgi:hypothetical protein
VEIFPDRTPNLPFAYPSKDIMLFANLLLSFALAAPASSPASAHLSLNTSEAEAVLNILDKRARGSHITDGDWQALFTSEPYIRLKKREASMHRDFTDEDFRRFVLLPELLAKRDALARTLANWKRADLDAAAGRGRNYLPAEATIKAKVYPVIKPKTNSFVFEPNTDPAIFLYLDPEQSASDFQNTVAHESHHIGLTDAQAKYDRVVEAAPEPQQALLNGSARLAKAKRCSRSRDHPIATRWRTSRRPTAHAGIRT